MYMLIVLSVPCLHANRACDDRLQRDGTVLYANMMPFYLEKRLAAASPCSSSSSEEGGETFHVFSLLLVSVIEGINAEDTIGKWSFFITGDVVFVIMMVW